VQAEAFDYPEEFFRRRIWTIPRARCDQELLRTAAQWLATAKSPLIVSGGGVLYSEATSALRLLAELTGIAVCVTQAGKGCLPHDHPQNVGAIGVTGTSTANILAREADLVVGIGTRYSDFTTSSKTAFQNSSVRFININVAEIDAYKHAAIALVGDALVTLSELKQAIGVFRIGEAHRGKISALKQDWNAEVDRVQSARK